MQRLPFSFCQRMYHAPPALCICIVCRTDVPPTTLTFSFLSCFLSVTMRIQISFYCVYNMKN